MNSLDFFFAANFISSKKLNVMPWITQSSKITSIILKQEVGNRRCCKIKIDHILGISQHPIYVVGLQHSKLSIICILYIVQKGASFI